MTKLHLRGVSFSLKQKQHSMKLHTTKNLIVQRLQANLHIIKLIIGSCESMLEIKDESIQLIVTSPPYYNAPFDYRDHFENYDRYLELIESFAQESFRVLEKGRIAAINTDDMLVNGVKFPIVADTTKIFQNAGFNYRDRIIWKKPDGYLPYKQAQRSFIAKSISDVFHPDNLLESILIFQKGKFNYKSKSKEEKDESKLIKKSFKKMAGT